MNQPTGGNVAPSNPKPVQMPPQTTNQPAVMPVGPQQTPTPPPSTPFQSPATSQAPGPNQDLSFQSTGMEAKPSGGKKWILIVVLVIILILGGLVFASWKGWISLGGLEKLWKKTPVATPTATTTKPTPAQNDAQRKADLISLKDALKKYYLANQSYPSAKTTQKTLDFNTSLTTLVPTYIAKLPVDPLSPTYYYGYTSDGKTFQLTAVLEDHTDASGIQAGDLFIYKVTDSSSETPTNVTPSSSTTTTNTTQ